MEGTATEALLRRERLIVSSCLLIICLLSWMYLLLGAGTGMSVAAMSTWQFPPPIYQHSTAHWPPFYWLLMAAMWWVMMIAMMVPSAVPMILLYARVQRHNSGSSATTGAVPTAAFLLGYLLVWAVFSVLATALQWGLEQTGLLHGMLMWSNSRTLTAGLLLLAGGYQFSPWKTACLSHCRSPAAYLAANWRHGRLGALRMGVTHGAYCLGCCIFLMLLLFAGGIMNLVWIAGLAGLVLMEKLLPRGALLARASGGLMILGGVWLLLT
jgi:predicted metal-binding membrane protein